MLRVSFREHRSLRETVLGSGERLVFGRSPEARLLPPASERETLRLTTVALPFTSRHTSRVMAELVVGKEVAQLRWSGTTGAQIVSLFDSPGGPRRGVLMEGMCANLDPGLNHLHILRGYESGPQEFADLLIEILVASSTVEDEEEELRPRVRYADASDEVMDRTAPAPGIARGSKEWFVALALAEPWLASGSDYVRPPTNREIFERVLAWRGYAWNLDRPQRVDDSLRLIAQVAFGDRDDPFSAPKGSRVKNVRFAIGKRAAEVRLVTPEDLQAVLYQQHARNTPPPGR